jgi:hypothetical protein
MSGSLRVLSDEFAAITRVADVGGSAGDSGLASALTDFATGWSEKRDPVPGDPEVLAALGGHMRDAAAEIESMAASLPKICGSEVWDSDAGQQFRRKAATTAAGIGKTHRRFFAVASALGRSTDGGGGYAARLHECQV